jgi:hypothetical protein
MAVSQSFKTYDAKANREDLADAIYNIDPYDTPFMTKAGRRNITNVTYDWQKENLKAVDTDNAQVEGFELARTASQPTVRIGNVAQISKKDATVSGSQNAANPAGKRKEMAHQMAMRSKELKRDMENILCGAQGRVNGDTVTPRRTRAWESWLETNVLRGATGASAADEFSSPTDGTQRVLTEALLKECLQSCYTNGAEPSIMLTGPYNKGIVSGFVGREQARQNIDKERVQATVSLYAGDFVTLQVMASRWVRERTASLIDPQYVRVAYYRNFKQEPLAKIGDAETRMILAEYGLQVDNEAAHGAIADLTTSA